MTPEQLAAKPPRWITPAQAGLWRDLVLESRHDSYPAAIAHWKNRIKKAERLLATMDSARPAAVVTAQPVPKRPVARATTFTETADALDDRFVIMLKLGRRKITVESSKEDS